MKLIIDRNRTDSEFYTIEFGPDFDILIFKERILTAAIHPETMAEIDKIVTRSVELKYCLMYIKHPLIMKNYNPDKNTSKFWNMYAEQIFKQQIRNYFSIRMQYRKYNVELTDIGKRLF